MRRRSLLLSVALLLVIAGGVLAALVVLIQHEPAFYARAGVAAGPQREEASVRFTNRWLNLFSEIKAGGDPKTGNWGAPSSEAEINSYLAEHFLNWGIADKVLPDGVSEPRVAIEQDRIRLAFRYGSPPWSTIISIDFRAWLAQAEPNVVVLELQRLHAGALPISAQSLLDEVSELLRRHNVQVSWYRHQGNPTAALKFQSDQPRPNAQLRQLDIRPGMLTIAGHSRGD